MIAKEIVMPKVVFRHPVDHVVEGSVDQPREVVVHTILDPDHVYPHPMPAPGTPGAPAQKAAGGRDFWNFFPAAVSIIALVFLGLVLLDKYGDRIGAWLRPALPVQQTQQDSPSAPVPQVDAPQPRVVDRYATPTGKPYVRPQTTTENGIEYTGNTCNRIEGTTGREGYGPNGGLVCWKF